MAAAAGAARSRPLRHWRTHHRIRAWSGWPRAFPGGVTTGVAGELGAANQPSDRPLVRSQRRPGSDLRCGGAASLGRLNNPTARLSETIVAAEMSTVARAISAVVPESGSVANSPSSPRQNGIDAPTRTGCTLRHACHAGAPNIQYGRGASSKCDGACRQSLQTVRRRYKLSISSSPKKASSKGHLTRLPTSIVPFQHGRARISEPTATTRPLRALRQARR